MPWPIAANFSPLYHIPLSIPFGGCYLWLAGSLYLRGTSDDLWSSIPSSNQRSQNLSLDYAYINSHGGNNKPFGFPARCLALHQHTLSIPFGGYYLWYIGSSSGREIYGYSWTNTGYTHPRARYLYFASDKVSPQSGYEKTRGVTVCLLAISCYSPSSHCLFRLEEIMTGAVVVLGFRIHMAFYGQIYHPVTWVPGFFSSALPTSTLKVATVNSMVLLSVAWLKKLSHSTNSHCLFRLEDTTTGIPAN